MKSATILDYMVRDHGKLLKLIADIEKKLGEDTISVMRAFDMFEWSLEKHVFTEEKAIFTFYNPKNITKGYAMVPELIKEHNEILNEMRIIRKNLQHKKHIHFEKFKQLLMQHKTFEEEKLYPQLDRELDESQKKVIIDRISEIL